jgi:hypothetical protein
MGSSRVSTAVCAMSVCNVEWFASLDDARAKLAKFREHYNRERPHSALADPTPAAFAELHRSKEKSSTLMENRVNSGRKELHCLKYLVPLCQKMGAVQLLVKL